MLHILHQLSRDQHNDSEFGKQARDLIRSAEPWPVQRYQTARFRPAKSLDRIVEIQVKYPNDQEFGERLRSWLGQNC